MRVFPFCSLNCFVSLEEQKLLLQGQDLGQTLGTHSPQVGKQSLTESEFFGQVRMAKAKAQRTQGPGG